MGDAGEFAGKHVVIVHGYTASPGANWFPWLASELRNRGARVDVPAMPDPQAPEPAQWAAALDEVAPDCDSDTFLVGHSLGAIVALRHVLTRRANVRVGGVLLVSGFDRTLATLPELAAFTSSTLAHGELVRRIERRASIFSDNDTIVAPAASRELAVALETSIDVVPGGGHFLDREGFTRLPQALEALTGFVVSR